MIHVFDWPEHEPLQIAYSHESAGCTFDSVRVGGIEIPAEFLSDHIVRCAQWIVEDISETLKSEAREHAGEQKLNHSRDIS